MLICFSTHSNYHPVKVDTSFHTLQRDACYILLQCPIDPSCSVIMESGLRILEETEIEKQS